MILGLLAAACAPASPDSTLFTNVLVVDGTGAPAYEGAVRIRRERIEAVGADLTPLRGETVVDGGGEVLAPGFIDTHSHAGGDLDDDPDAEGAVSQGITTIVSGQDGSSSLPVADFFANRTGNPAAINVASYTGHGTLRRRVMGDDFKRPATPAEIDSMGVLLAADMAAGSLGLSTGLEYDPGIYSTPDEVVALAKVAAASGGRYISHMRSEDRHVFEAVDELIRIGREAGLPVQISHVKLAMKSLWGQAPRLLAHLDSARAAGVDVTADIYPYLAWHSTMTVLFPEREYTREAAAFALEELAPPEGMILSTFTADTSYQGRTLADVAAERGEEPVTTYLKLIDMTYGPDAPPDADEGIIARSMAPEDVATLMAWPHTNICTDGDLDGTHPRGWGSFTRVLGRYVREDGVLSLEEAVHKMTQLSAQHVGLTERGVLAPGMMADLVLFDPATVLDQADFGTPHVASVGVDGVWVAGRQVWNGAATGAHPGRPLLRPGA